MSGYIPHTSLPYNINLGSKYVFHNPLNQNFLPVNIVANKNEPLRELNETGDVSLNKPIRSGLKKEVKSTKMKKFILYDKKTATYKSSENVTKPSEMPINKFNRMQDIFYDFNKFK